MSGKTLLKFKAPFIKLTRPSRLQRAQAHDVVQQGGVRKRD